MAKVKLYTMFLCLLLTGNVKGDDGQKCFHIAKSLTAGLVDLNKRFWDANPKVEHLVTKGDWNIDDLNAWANQTTKYREELSKAATLVHGCVKLFISQVNMEKVEKKMEDVIVSTFPDSEVWDKSTCDHIGVSVVKGLLSLNEMYIPLAEKFFFTAEEFGEKDFVAWLQLVLPYWSVLRVKDSNMERCVVSCLLKSDKCSVKREPSIDAKMCLARAKKATRGLIRLNKYYMDKAAEFTASQKPKTEVEMQKWAYYMASYYKHLRTEDKVLKACSIKYHKTAPAEVLASIKTAIDIMKKASTPESVLAEMSCPILAVNVTKGIYLLNKYYMGKAKQFISMKIDPVKRIHLWLQYITPYWVMLNGDSPASTACVMKYLETPEPTPTAIDAKMCLARAKKATKGLIRLNKYYMDKAADFVASQKPKTESEMQKWAYYMAEYYKHLKTEDKVLKACSIKYHKSAPAEVLASIKTAIDIMKKASTPESVLAEMSCPILAVNVTKGIYLLNKYYMGKAKQFMTMKIDPVKGMHLWLQYITPYWVMLNGESPASTACVMKYLETPEPTPTAIGAKMCLARAKKATRGLIRLNKDYMDKATDFVASQKPKTESEMQKWAYYMAEYYKHLKTEDKVLKACSIKFHKSAPAEVLASIKTAIDIMKKASTPESVLAEMSCPTLAVNVTKGIYLLNKYYMGKAKQFMKMKIDPVKGMHLWLQYITPYWVMLNGESPASTACVMKYLETPEPTPTAIDGETCFKQAQNRTKWFVQIMKEVWGNDVISDISKKKELEKSDLFTLAKQGKRFLTLMMKKDEGTERCAKQYLMKVNWDKVKKKYKQLTSMQTPESTLKKMTCSGVYLILMKQNHEFNKKEIALGTKFAEQKENGGEVGFVEWLEYVLPYAKVAKRKSPTAENCFKSCLYMKPSCTTRKTFGDYCYTEALGATTQLIELNKRFWSDEKPSTNMDLHAWSVHMVEYYKKLKSSNVIDDCVTKSMETNINTRKVNMTAVSKAVAEIKKHSPTEESLAKLSCAELATKVSKGMYMFNKYYTPIMEKYISSKQHAGGDGFVGWVEMILPYWKTLHGRSAAVEKCISDNIKS